MEQQHAQLETLQAADLEKLDAATSEVHQTAPAPEIIQAASVVRDSKALPWKPVNPTSKPRPV